MKSDIKEEKISLLHMKKKRQPGYILDFQNENEDRTDLEVYRNKSSDRISKCTKDDTGNLIYQIMSR